MSEGLRPALATVTHEPFWDDGWVYEPKLDGQRVLATATSGRVQLRSRTGQDLSATFPEIVTALRGRLARDCVLDGEVVAFAGANTSFQRLQQRLQTADAAAARRSQVRVHVYLFDLLRDGDEDVRAESLLQRKRRLREVVDFSGPVHYTPHRRRRAAGDSYLRECCRRGWEGLIAKRADAAYPRGRTGDWQKFKCEAGQELLVVGWTDPTGSRPALGALLLGYHRGGELVYAGKVGTGFTKEVLVRLRGLLDRLERDTSPCTRGRLPDRGVHWAEPRLVAEVAFTEWTEDGGLRHPRYQGLRTDKPAEEVVLE